MIPQSSAVSLPSVRPLAHSWPQLFMETYLYLFKKQEPAANQKVVCFKWAGLEDELRSCTKNREKINEELRLIQSTSRRVQE